MNPGHDDDNTAPKTTTEGTRKVRHGQDLLDSVAAAKSKAARLNPNDDRSAAVADLARREGWSKGR